MSRPPAPPAPRPRVDVALVGECMIELRGQAFGTLTQGFGGDTFNTAVYLARCGARHGIRAHYATGLGTDELSRELLRRWADEGIGLELVRQVEGRSPGLYQIDVDARGERRFSYWRDSSAARAYFDAETTPLEADPGRWQVLYLSGISLAILPPAGRERLYALMRAARARGALVAFDNNYRPRLWTSVAQARESFARATALADLAFVTADDHAALFGLADPAAALRDIESLPTPEIAVKRGALSTLVRTDGGGEWQAVPTQEVPVVVDSTAAGDSFAAGYLCRRLLGADAVEAAHFGNRLAARVIAHPGALIAREAMADLA